MRPTNLDRPLAKVPVLRWGTAGGRTVRRCLELRQFPIGKEEQIKAWQQKDEAAIAQMFVLVSTLMFCFWGGIVEPSTANFSIHVVRYRFAWKLQSMEKRQTFHKNQVLP